MVWSGSEGTCKNQTHVCNIFVLCRDQISLRFALQHRLLAVHQGQIVMVFVEHVSYGGIGHYSTYLTSDADIVGTGRDGQDGHKVHKLAVIVGL